MKFNRGSKLPADIKNIIVDYHLSGNSTLSVQRILFRRNGISVSRQTVHRIISNFKRTGNVRRSRPRRESKLRPVHKNIIDLWLRTTPELTAEDIRLRLCDKFGITVSRQYVSEVRKSLGWKKRSMKYCQMISNKNKVNRYNYACSVLKAYETFEDVVFVDETSIEMSSNGRLFFHKASSDISKLPQKAPKPKHAYKVHMWGGISYKGRTDCCIFTGIMDSVIYQKILTDNFLPFVRSQFTTSYRLYQDNDSKHCSKSTQAWMEENGVNNHLLKAPASSPDLNPIENVWSALKDNLQRKVKPRTKAELVDGIVKFWESLSAEKCGTYIDHIHRVLPHVVLNYGGPTEF